MNEQARPAEILLVEDSPSDAELTRAALQEGKLDNRLHHVKDGVEAIEFLRRQGAYASAPRPDMVLLDLNLPRLNGLEVLRQVRQIDKEVGVIMVTAVNEEQTGRQALELGAFDYIVKPLDLEYLERSLWYKVTTMML